MKQLTKQIDFNVLSIDEVDMYLMCNLWHFVEQFCLFIYGFLGPVIRVFEGLNLDGLHFGLWGLLGLCSGLMGLCSRFWVICISKGPHHVDNVLVAMSLSNVQRSYSVLVTFVGISSSLEKKLCDIPVAHPSDNVQWCPREC